MSFASLKQSSALETLVKKLEKQGGGYNNKDDRFWEPYQDKNTGLGSAIIRFLPTAPNADAPWVQTFKHSFKNEETGKWFIHECPSTIGQECFCCNIARPLWKGSDADKAVARERGRKGTYISNILVLKDPANPENEGKLFLFRYGKQVFDKILQKIKPEFEDDKPVNVFDFWGGSNFSLRITKNVAGYRSYEKSVFSEPTPLFGGDDTQLEALWNKQYDLNEFLNPELYKADKMQERYEAVVNGTAPVATSAANRVLEQMNEAATAKPSFSAPTKSPDDIPAAKPDASDDDWDKLLSSL